MLRAVAEQFGADPTGPTAFAIADTDQLPAEPELEALARLSRGHTHLEHDDRAGARAEWGAALALSRRHGFDYLRMQCLALLGIVAGLCGELRTMRTVSSEALAVGADHGWQGSPWSAAAAAMSGYGDLLRHLPADAERRTADALAALPATVSAAAASSPASRFALHAVHGAALFDLGDRADGLAELQQARSDFGDNQTSPQHCAAMAMLEFRVALLLGHAAAARTVLGWLTERTGDNAEDNAELVAMRAWTEAAAGHHEHARTLIRPVLDGSAPALLPHTVVEGWLLETSIAAAADERPAARHALQTALALAEPLDALRPFIQAGPHVARAADTPARQLRRIRAVREPACSPPVPVRQRQTSDVERAGNHRARAAALHAVTRGDRPRPHRVGEHRQEPPPIDLHEARREQPPTRRARRPRARAPQQQRALTRRRSTA